MNTILKTTLFAGTLMIGSTMTAQSLVNESKETKFQKFETSQKTYTVKTIVKKMQPILFNPNDKGKIDQRTIPSPIIVSKTIYIDNNNDNLHDKKVELSYTKDSEDLDYNIEQNGFLFLKDKNNSYLLEDGEYNIETEIVGDVYVSIEEI